MLRIEHRTLILTSYSSRINVQLSNVSQKPFPYSYMCLSQLYSENTEGEVIS
jgi:hypothetical protein